MKNLFILCFLALIFLFSTSHYANAQISHMCSNGVIEQIADWCNSIKQSGYQVVRIESDLIFKDKPKEITRRLSKGKKYSVFAVASGDRVSDVDLFIYKKIGSDWVQIGKDDDETNLSIVNDIIPAESGDYKFIVNAYSFKGDHVSGHYALILAHDECNGCSHLSSNGVISNLKEIVCKLEGEEKEVVHIESDLLYDTPKTIYRRLSSQYNYRIAAISSDRIEDIDMTVYKNVNGKWNEVGKDDDFTNVAVVDVNPSNDGEYKFEVSAFKFSGSMKSGHYAIVIFH